MSYRLNVSTTVEGAIYVDLPEDFDADDMEEAKAPRCEEWDSAEWAWPKPVPGPARVRPVPESAWVTFPDGDRWATNGFFAIRSDRTPPPGKWEWVAPERAEGIDSLIRRPRLPACPPGFRIGQDGEHISADRSRRAATVLDGLRVEYVDGIALGVDADGVVVAMVALCRAD